MTAARHAILLALPVLVVGCEPAREDRPDKHVQAGAAESTHAERLAAYHRPAVQGHLITAREVAALREQGLRNPVQQVVDSLIAHREVIPHEGVLGGTIRFHPDYAIHVLDDSWVYASFDDGHIQGRGIFSYEVQPDSSISFRAELSVID